MNKYKEILEDPEFYPKEIYSLVKDNYEDRLETQQARENRLLKIMCVIYSVNHLGVQVPDETKSSLVLEKVYKFNDSSNTADWKHQYDMSGLMAQLKEEVGHKRTGIKRFFESSDSESDEERNRKLPRFMEEGFPSTSRATPLSPMYEPMSPEYLPESPPYIPLSPTPGPSRENVIKEIEEEEFMDSDDDFVEDFYDTGFQELEQGDIIDEQLLLNEIDAMYYYTPIGWGDQGKEYNKMLLRHYKYKSDTKFDIWFHGVNDFKNEPARLIYFDILPSLTSKSIMRIKAESIIETVKMKDGKELPDDHVIAYFAIDREGLRTYSYRMPDSGLPGLDLVRDFLARRKNKYIPNDIIDTIPSLQVKEIFCSKEFENEYEEWSSNIDSIMDSVRGTHDYTLSHEITDNIDKVPVYDGTIDNIFYRLSIIDDEKKKLDQILFRSKLIPSCWTTLTLLEHSNDSQRSNEFIKNIGEILEVNIINYEKNSISSDNIKSIIMFIKNNFDGTTNTLCRTKMDRKTNATVIVLDRNIELLPLKEMLGIGRKGVVFTANPQGTKQEENKDQTRKGYPKWSCELISDLSLPLKGMETTPWMLDIQREMIFNHNPMAELAEFVNKVLSDTVKRSSACCMMSKITNFYSRLGGSYQLKKGEKGSSYSNICIGPLVSNDPVNKKAYIDGIFIRGPQHAKESTDKISYITIEKTHLNKDFVTENFSKCFFIATSTGNYIMQQNSIKKEDTSYLTFCQNGVFIISNSTGEVLMSKFMELYKDYVALDELKIDALNQMKGSEEFMNKMMAMMVFICMTGNSQDEEYLATVRMLYMNAIMWCNQGEVKNLSLNSLIDSFQECLINAPFSHWHFQTLMVSMKRMVDYVNALEVDEDL